MANFVLIDLISQRHALSRFLCGLDEEQKIAWISRKGELRAIACQPPFPQTYAFRSVLGMYAAFYIQNDQIFCFGDHCILR